MHRHMSPMSMAMSLWKYRQTVTWHVTCHKMSLLSRKENCDRKQSLLAACHAIKFVATSRHVTCGDKSLLSRFFIAWHIGQTNEAAFDVIVMSDMSSYKPFSSPLLCRSKSMHAWFEATIRNERNEMTFSKEAKRNIHGSFLGWGRFWQRAFLRD